MSSTGIVSEVVSNPTTSMGEERRQTQGAIASFPGVSEGLRQVFGVIRKIHKDKPLVTASSDDGGKIANGRWIPLNHSVQEIVERFGKIKKGMRVVVFFTGPDGAGANATITGNPGERDGQTKNEDNSIKRGMFRIFAPGIGIG